MAQDDVEDPHTYLDPRTFRWREPATLLMLLQRRCNAAAAGGLWGLWRNGQLDIAKVLVLAQREDDALDQLLWVIYVDANGPRNSEPPFRGASSDFFAAGVLKDALDLSRGPLDEGQFVRVAGERRLVNMPTSPELAWQWLRENASEQIDRTLAAVDNEKEERHA